MDNVNITLTRNELDRLITVFAYNIDVNIQKQLDKAMERKQESEVARLLAVKASDQALLTKLHGAL